MGIKIEARGRIDRPRTTLEDTVVEWRVVPDDLAWRRLDPKTSLRIRNHSPSGFSWGYEGSGPAQLALAILLAGTDRHFAVAYYQRFKRDVIAALRWIGDGASPSEPWEIRVDVERWLASSHVRDSRPDAPIAGVEISQPVSPDGWATPRVVVEPEPGDYAGALDEASGTVYSDADPGL